MALSSLENPLLTIDDFAFQYFEVPEFIKFGGSFRAVVHKQPGGARQIDSMGPDPGPISWDGIMLASGPGGTGSDRVGILYAKYEAGLKVLVTWANWPSRYCVITDFKVKYRAVNYVEYFIELTEVTPLNAVSVDTANTVGNLSALLAHANAIGGAGP